MKQVIVIGGCHINYPAFQENLKSKYEYVEFINTHMTSSDFTEKLNSLNSLNSLIILQLGNAYFSNSINLNFPIFQKYRVHKSIEKQVQYRYAKESKDAIGTLIKLINVPISIVRILLTIRHTNIIELEKHLHHLNQLGTKTILVTPFYSLNKLNNIVRKSSMMYFSKLAKYFENIELIDGYSAFEENDFLDKYHLNENGITKLNERINNLIEKIQDTKRSL